MDLGFIKRWILFGAPPWQERRRQHPQARSTQDERRMHAGRRYRTAQWGWQPQDRWRYLVHFLVWLRDPECARQWNITGWIRDLWCQGNGQSGVFVAQIQKKKTAHFTCFMCCRTVSTERAAIAAASTAVNQAPCACTRASLQVAHTTANNL